MAFSLRIAATSLIACFLGALTGCNSSSDKEVDMQSGPNAVGKKVFTASCARCHKIGGPSDEGRAPNLAKTGANPEHTAEWFMELVRDPKSKNPKAKMPAFHDSIKEDDLRALAEFLTSLK
jgi:mono/diheme cytochrome c family protein